MIFWLTVDCVEWSCREASVKLRVSITTTKHRSRSMLNVTFDFSMPAIHTFNFQMAPTSTI